MSGSIDDKLDNLLVQTTALATTQAAIVTRMAEVEQKRDKRDARVDERMEKIELRSDKFEKFVDNCNLGRRVLIWGVSAVGSVAAFGVAVYSALQK